MKKIFKGTLLIILIITILTGCTTYTTTGNTECLVTIKDTGYTYNVPYYSGNPTYTLSSNPVFAEFELRESAYEDYGALDNLGRCTLTSAIVCIDTMPKQGEKRGSISSVKPSGWVQAKYDCVPGKMLYNRCHLIGWQLTAENANKKNLITGTRYLNIDGMLDIENSVATHVKSTNHYVAYQVTPIYNGDDLVPLGVQMEVDCISCNATGTTLNVFCYNVQPGVIIDYGTGKSHLE